MSHERIVALIDRFSEEEDSAKKNAIINELLELVADERAQRNGEPSAAD